MAKHYSDPVDQRPYGGLVAIGSLAFSETAVWTSADALSWTDAGRLDHEFVAAAALSDQLVVFTVDYDDAGWVVHRGTLGP